MLALLDMATVSQRQVRQARPPLSLEHVRDAQQKCVSTATSPISGLCYISKKIEDSVIAAGGLLWIQAQRLSKASLLLSHCPVSSGPKSTVQKLSSHLALIALIFGTSSWGQGLNEHRGWMNPALKACKSELSHVGRATWDACTLLSGMLLFSS